MENNCCSNRCGCGGNRIPSHRMCQLTQQANKFDLKKVKNLTSNPKLICRCCGRTANDKENLCSPEKLN